MNEFYNTLMKVMRNAESLFGLVLFCVSVFSIQFYDRIANEK